MISISTKRTPSVSKIVEYTAIALSELNLQPYNLDLPFFIFGSVFRR